MSLTLHILSLPAVIDRQFKGDIAHTMDKLTTRALQAQVEAANVDRENSNKIKQEEGALSVARVKAQTRNVSLSPFFPPQWHLNDQVTTQ